MIHIFRLTSEAGYSALRHPIGNEVSLLWEWLPATIIAARCRSHKKTKSTFSEAGAAGR
jgi:hypothetical protein